jgi:hypothetical protein
MLWISNSMFIEPFYPKVMELWSHEVPEDCIHKGKYLADVSYATWNSFHVETRGTYFWHFWTRNSHISG